MRDSLADLDTLVLRCRSERSREYITEAVQCYRAGAYRSAIVTTWIAIVFDLVDKIRELALAGDQGAAQINARYESYIQQINDGNDQGVKAALEFERSILAVCRTSLQFFDHQQMRDLERLREDRHQCAHPSFHRAGIVHRPAAELARLHIRNAVEHVLSQPPVQGRSAIDEAVTTISSEYFPRDDAQAITVLRQSALGNPSSALVRGVIDALVFGYANPESPLHGKLQVAYALAALLEMHRADVEPRIAQQLSRLVKQIADVDFPAVARLLAVTPELVAHLDDAASQRLIGFVRLGPIMEVMPSMAGLVRNQAFDQVVRERILEFDSSHLAIAIADFGFGELAKERALGLLATAGDWVTANSIFEEVVLPLFGSMNRSDVERIIRMHTEHGSDLPGSHMFGQFMEQVRRSALIPQPELEQLLHDNGAEYLVRRWGRERRE